MRQRAAGHARRHGVCTCACSRLVRSDASIGAYVRGGDTRSAASAAHRRRPRRTPLLVRPRVYRGLAGDSRHECAGPNSGISRSEGFRVKASRHHGPAIKLASSMWSWLCVCVLMPCAAIEAGSDVALQRAAARHEQEQLLAARLLDASAERRPAVRICNARNTPGDIATPPADGAEVEHPVGSGPDFVNAIRHARRGRTDGCSESCSCVLMYPHLCSHSRRSRRIRSRHPGVVRVCRAAESRAADTTARRRTAAWKRAVRRWRRAIVLLAQVRRFRSDGAEATRLRQRG